MIAGLPGTGIGGLFYVVLALSMPLFEAYRRLSKKAAATPTSRIIFQLSLVVAIIGALWGGGYLLFMGYQLLIVAAPGLESTLVPDNLDAWGVLVPALAFSQVAFLSLIVVVLNVAAFFVRKIPDPHPLIRQWKR